MGPSKSSSHPVIAETFKCFFSGSSPLLNTHSSGVANGSHISWCDSRITLILENITSRIYDTCFWRPSIWVTRGWNCRLNHGLRRKKKFEKKKNSVMQNPHFYGRRERANLDVVHFEISQKNVLWKMEHFAIFRAAQRCLHALTHFCPPLRFRNQFLPTVPTFAVR